MNYLDTDTTHTDWSEFEAHNEPGRCPITGVSTAPGYVTAGFPGDSPADSPAERSARSNPKLQAMFDKFLYQK
jgi:hypothetical protein